jgi:hypothetical protein
MELLITVLALLVAFQLKHFLADYPFQNEYMLGKFKSKGWVKPLAAHAGVHAFMTFLITGPLVGAAKAVTFATFDFGIHFVMDRIKASPRLLGRFKALSAKDFRVVAMVANQSNAAIEAREEARSALRANKYFWWALGADQTVHHLTHYAIIAMVMLS